MGVVGWPDGYLVPQSPPFPSTAPNSCSVCIIAADISPLDVIAHLPVFCETQGVPYVFVTSKEASIGVLWVGGWAKRFFLRRKAVPTARGPRAAGHAAHPLTRPPPFPPLPLQELGAAGLTKRPTSTMLLLAPGSAGAPTAGGAGDDGYGEAFADAAKRVGAVQRAG